MGTDSVPVSVCPCVRISVQRADLAERALLAPGVAEQWAWGMLFVYVGCEWVSASRGPRQRGAPAAVRGAADE